MKKSLSLWGFSQFVLTAALGTFLHFLFSFSRCYAFSPISAVNESTFEHMKILFFPQFFFALFQSRFVRRSDYWKIKLRSTCLSAVAMPVLFYTLTGLFGTLRSVVNILIFFLCAIAAPLYEERALTKPAMERKKETTYFLLFLFLAIFFALCTFFPPKIPLFQDPVHGGYGI